MPKSTAAEPTPLTEPVFLPLESLPHLQVFALPFDPEGDIPVRIRFEFPADKNPLPSIKHTDGNRGLVSLKKSANGIEITTKKIWGLSFDFFKKQFGPALAKNLAAPPSNTILTVDFNHKKGSQSYRGQIIRDQWRLKATHPFLPNVELTAALKVAAFRFSKAITCADASEADAIEAAVAKVKYLRSMGVKRAGLKFSCTHDDGRLAALVFHLRHGESWGFPPLAAKRKPPKGELETAVETWRAQATPSAKAAAHFETIRKLLADRSSNLKTRTQDFPPRVVHYLPVKKGEHEWEFASIAAVGDDAYFDLYPLGLDVALRNRVSKTLRAWSYRPDDGFKIPGAAKIPLAELQSLIADATTWFDREIVAARPLPPCQLIDHYLIEPVGGVADSDDEPTFDETGAALNSLGDSAAQLLRRLQKVFGKGDWKLAAFDVSAQLPGWPKPCTVELHRYQRGKTAEPWKIKRFLKGAPKETASDVSLAYAAASDFKASLERGKSYRCTATLGKKFQSYVRIIDESGENYWYPERFFPNQ